MTPAELATYVRFKTRTNTTTFTDANILALLKVRCVEVASKLLETGNDDFLITYTEDLVDDQRLYPFQDDYMKLKKVRAKLDETNFITLKEMDVSQHDRPTDETNITYNFSNTQGDAFFDIQHGGIFIYSGTIEDVTNGLVTKYAKEPVVITDLASVVDMSAHLTSTTHGYPKRVHELLARGVIIDYKESREKPIPLTEREAKYEFDLVKAVNELKNTNLDNEILAQLPGQGDRGNEGAEY